MTKILRLILGDQLHHGHSWFQKVDASVHYVMMEIRPEATYVRHHIQKIIAFFLAMRAFAQSRQEAGHIFHYYALNDPENRQSLEGNILQLIEKEGFTHFEYLLPDEYRLDKQLQEISQSLPIPARADDTEHFLTSREALGHFFKGKKTYLLESFYRDIRRRFQILMEGDEPLTGRWNYDAENRRAYDGKVPIPSPPLFDRNVEELVAMIEKAGIPTLGHLNAQCFPWPVTREESLQTLYFFVEKALPFFGTYQDAMVPDEPFLFHSRLSFALNTKLLSPMEVIQAAIAAWEKQPAQIHIAQLEGFVRQIAGWREYMRGVYWANMPGYAQKNYFEHQAELPHFYWTGETRMQCLSQAIGQSLSQAYAHHIQRLMLTGNFALLAGVHPDAVDEWYLGIYIDAIEWVEITNTRGMSQYADGGLVATKPYVSSANYIDKMSTYCRNCYYDKKKRYGPKACPFNSLYWEFYERHTDKLARNARIGMAYRNLQKMDSDEKAKIMAQAQFYRQNLNSL
ncbi:MAG: cryptochrome/photolyase family protein [Microscillaceae bacterium]|nr:cryptochrome/photolyase family protein [Microscillaceae bacterium]